MPYNPIKMVKLVQQLADNVIRLRGLYQDIPAPPIVEMVIERDCALAFAVAIDANDAVTQLNQ